MVTFWAYVRFHLLLWGLRAAWRVLRWTVTAAGLVAVAPMPDSATTTHEPASTGFSAYPYAALIAQDHGQR